MSTSQPLIQLPAPGEYRHHKGGIYHLAWVARLEASGEWMCCYFADADFVQWVRPASEWFEWVSPGKRRFTSCRPAQ